MTTQNDTQPPMIKNEPMAPKSKITTRFIVFFLIVVLSGLFYAFKTTQHIHQLEQQLQKNTQTLKQQETTDIKQIDYELNITRTFETLLDKKIASLNKSLQQAIQQRWFQANDWILLKARYYLELAEINAHWSDNAKTTIALLQQADNLLATIHDQRLLTIRQTIATEISQQEQAPTVDIVGILSQLDAVQHSIKRLSFKKSKPLLQSNLTTNDNMRPTWRDRLKDSLNQLEKLIVIQRHDFELQPILTPAYESMLRENIRLNLQQAQWAVIQPNQEVYALALSQAIDNITRAFDLSMANTQTLIKQLHLLQAINLLQPKLALNQSLLLLNQFIDLKINEQKNPVTEEHAP